MNTPSFSVSSVKWHFIIQMAQLFLCFYVTGRAPPCMHIFAHSHTAPHAYALSLTCTHTHTLTHNDQFQLLPACLLYLGHFEKQAVWMMNPLWQSARVSLPLHQNYTSAMLACVYVYISWNSRPFLFSKPIQGCRRKAPANILICSWLESNLSWPWVKIYWGWVCIYDLVQTS